MSLIKETAERFFDACETGKGWEGCQQYCHAGATFSAQAGALANVDTLQAYTDWMKGLLTFPMAGTRCGRSLWMKLAATWPRTPCSGAPTLGRADRCLRPESG